MKYEHKIGEPFKATRKDGKQFTLVAVEAPTTYDKHYNQHFRKTCAGCVFCKRVMKYVSGHGYVEEKCMLGSYSDAKCGPEHRQDGNMVEYHIYKLNIKNL